MTLQTFHALVTSCRLSDVTINDGVAHTCTFPQSLALIKFQEECITADFDLKVPFSICGGYVVKIPRSAWKNQDDHTSNYMSNGSIFPHMLTHVCKRDAPRT